MPRFEPSEAVRLFARSTVFMGVPTLYSRLVAEPGLSPLACRSMRLFISGSAPLSEETWTAFQAASGHEIVERYGTTETSVCCTNPLSGQRRPGTVGQPIPTAEVRVVTETGQVCAPGDIGEIQIAGPSVFGGYWKRDGRRGEDFTEDGFFRPGDLGRWSDDGYLSIVGRKKDMIITGGYNVYAREVENVIERITGVREVAVFGVPHPDFGEGVVAAVLADEEGAALSERAIIAAARRELAAYKAPKRVLFETSFPRTAVGKVQKGRLKEMHLDIFGPTVRASA